MTRSRLEVSCGQCCGALGFPVDRPDEQRHHARFPWGRPAGRPCHAPPPSQPLETQPLETQPLETQPLETQPLEIMPDRLPPAEYLRQRNDLWQRLRLLEPHDPAFEPLLEELRSLTNQSRDKVMEGLGLKRVPVTDAVFDLAINRAAAFMRGAGAQGKLTDWHAKTRFAARVDLERIAAVVATMPRDGAWHWAGGSDGAWQRGKPRTP